MFLITMSSSRLQFNNALLTVLAVLHFDLGLNLHFRLLGEYPVLGHFFGVSRPSTPPEGYNLYNDMGINTSKGRR